MGDLARNRYILSKMLPSRGREILAEIINEYVEPKIVEEEEPDVIDNVPDLTEERNSLIEAILDWERGTLDGDELIQMAEDLKGE